LRHSPLNWLLAGLVVVLQGNMFAGHAEPPVARRYRVVFRLVCQVGLDWVQPHDRLQAGQTIMAVHNDNLLRCQVDRHEEPVVHVVHGHHNVLVVTPVVLAGWVVHGLRPGLLLTGVAGRDDKGLAIDREHRLVELDTQPNPHVDSLVSAIQDISPRRVNIYHVFDPGFLDDQLLKVVVGEIVII